MKKIIIVFFITILSLFTPVSQVNASVSYSARNYIVMDGYTQEVLEGKDIHSAYSVASISKIMTAVIALESRDLFKVIIVDEIINTIEGSSLYLAIGDQITIIDLVYGLLLRSGNDAAVLIASNLAKDVDAFVEKMNKKAQEIGMVNTTFHNPSGLDIFDQGNISSAYDMALLMSYCMENELFREITSTVNYKTPLKGTWLNKNKLLRQYEYCIGGKTGFTAKARRTLVTAGKKDDQYLIVVTLNCGSDFAYHKFLYEKYFNAYHYLFFLQKGNNYIDDYVIYSEKVIGMRLKKEIALKGIKVYHINTSTDELEISFIDANGNEIKGGIFKCARLIN